jgi:hypothetical protein|tara:strand:- start:2770 stop:3612 length:843 start_codon:yes stop_codon:yes gene_type:complete
MPETREQRIQRRLEEATERSRQEEKIKGGIASMWESMNPGQKLGMAPIPVVSDIAGAVGDIQMYKEEPETRTGLNYALSGLGLIPGVPAVAGWTKSKKLMALEKRWLDAMTKGKLSQRWINKLEDKVIVQKNAEIAKANRKLLKNEDIEPEYIDEMIEDYAGEILSVEEGTGNIGAFDRMWPDIPLSHKGDDMTRQFLEELGYEEVFDVWEKAPNTFIQEGDKVVTYTPSFNKSGIEQKTFRDPTFGELRDFFGFSEGGMVTKAHGGFIDKAITGGSKDI